MERFPDDCPALLKMVDETDEFSLCEKNIGGLTFKDRNDFLQHRVLSNFDFTEHALSAAASGENLDRFAHQVDLDELDLMDPAIA